MKTRRMLIVSVSLLMTLAALVALARPQAASGMAAAATTPVTFAMIGDYGGGDTNYSNETSVANLVKSWNSGFIVTEGDDWYPWVGGTGGNQYDLSTGKYYCSFLAGITTPGTNCKQPGPASTNRFFPALGNHEYDAGTTNGLPTTYTDYFNLPGAGVTSSRTSGNERYYDFVEGPVHFFIVNSDNGTGQEPDGVTSTSKQAMWLKAQLAAATETWKIVVFHHPPFSSGVKHGSSAWMDWPFVSWGADAVVSGHEHLYERVMHNGIPYFTNGAGGANQVGYTCGTRVAGSQVCIDSKFGALRVTASDTALDFTYITTDGTTRDTYHAAKSGPTPTSTPGSTKTPAPTATKTPTGAPTATPDPGTGTKVTTTIASAADDGFQDGTAWTTDSTSLWIGDNKNTSASYAGLRFAGVAVPKGSTIQSARLRLYAPVAGSMAINVRIYGDAAGSSAAFSTSSLPGSRSFTSAYTGYANPAAWSAGTWASIDVTSVVKEIAARGDWASGNALSLIVKGMSGSQGDRRLAKGRSSADSTNDPQLVITYQ